MKKSMMILFIFSVASIVLFVSQANAWEMTITASGTYELTGDLNCTDGKGIYIKASNVTLDGKGYIIQCADDVTPGDGIYSSGKSNITIKNCVIKDFRFGMYLKSGSNFLITGNTIDLSSSDYASCRAIYLRYISNSTVENNNIDGSTYLGITIAKDTSTGNIVQFNNIKNCPQKTASDSGTDNTWDSNYYDDAIDWDCDGRAVHVIGNAADLNAYIEKNGWALGPIAGVDEDGDGYGEGCQLGPDRNDDKSKINDYREKVFDNLQDDDLDWEYICRPWWLPGECDFVNVSIVPFLGPSGPSAQSMEIAIPVVDTTDFDWSQYIDIFYVDDEAKKKEGGMDWSRYHTMTFWVYPVNNERQTTHLGVRIDNDPTCRNDLAYPETLFTDDCREFQRGFMLASNTWNKVVLDISQDVYAGGLHTPGTPRPTTLDNIKSVRFFTDRNPTRWVDDQAVTFHIDAIRLLRDLKEE